ncbi:unnamed protein product [Chondrus crispus]|uniref:Uncharacterized protein n=1 Tax=Chondrus crispus TaxID=2769 RepID=R7QU83_CHOCR|nr:unnamed protein product [Chondrus crispus]CDF41026.1 unnamed protein product [Chondrus crispus]|eukprot:XP_005711320.1 unnamed protein product [Chondrus crispus]
MTSQPPGSGSWRLQENTTSPNVAAPGYRPNISSSSNLSPTQNVSSGLMYSTMQPPPGPSSNNPPPTTLRKRQFRFSVRADIELLKLVHAENPYAAAHGSRLQKWQAIANTLRSSSIEIDFRRARDRTGLLLEQWRDKDLSLLRRSGSGNQEDQAEKETLLEQISRIEQATRPRDNDWRSREQMRQRNQLGAAACQLPGPHQDNPSEPHPSLNVMTGVLDHRANKLNNYASGPSPQLPPIVQKRDHHSMSQGRSDADPQTIQYGSHQVSSEKHFKTNQGRAAISSTFTQPLFGNPPSPPQVNPLQSQSVDRRSPPGGDLSPYPNRLPILRQPNRGSCALGNPHAIATAALEVNPIRQVTTSPRVREGQVTPLDRSHDIAPRNDGLKGDFTHLLDRVTNVERRLDDFCAFSERRLDDLCTFSEKLLEVEERRFQWEKECEARRRQMEEERRAREIEEKTTEREERRRKDAKDQEDHRRLLELIVRSRSQNVSEGINEEH